MADLKAKDLKLIQYLNEAYAKEKQLETGLEAHIAMTNRAPYKRRLQQHLRETKSHAREVERRIKQLGGRADEVKVPGPEAVTEAVTRAAELARKGVAALQGPIHVLRGTGEQEKLLKNAKTEFQEEAEEIAHYTAIEQLAQIVGDRETAKLARQIRREEERMRDFLARLIPQLTKAVATEEIPAAERNGGRRRTTRRRKTTSRGRTTTARRRTATPRGRTATARGRTTTARSRSGSPSRSTRSRSSSRASGSRSSSRTSGKRSASSRSGGSRSRASSRS